METLYSNRYLVISYVPEKNCLVQSWTGFCTSEEYREGQKKSVELFLQKRCKNFISDASKASLLKKEDTDWVTEVITPQFVKAGMPVLNLVLPESAFTKMTIMNLEKAEEGASNVRLAFFNSMESALASI
jgi:hypothetical protein